ncbi:MAG: nucleotidyltransferase domain-containing protein [Dehalococcoidia bacterium]|nr:nucleotidyltransferase domain-containing protein [Dehalococcoidia bacterium]
MSTLSVSNGLATTLFGKARRAILSLLYGHAEEAFYLRQIARTTGIGLGPVQRELKQLTDAGIIQRTVRGKQVYYQANVSCPIFAELKGLIIKTVGLADVLREVLAPLAEQITTAFVYGSMANGEAISASDIDLLVVGDIDEMALHRALSQAENQLGRPVNYTLMSHREFDERRSQKDGFLARVLSGQKIMILGSINGI